MTVRLKIRSEESLWWLVRVKECMKQCVNQNLSFLLPVPLNIGKVSPPPPSGIMTAHSLTEWQTAFVGPHHLQKSSGQNHQSTTEVTLNERSNICT